MIIVRTFSQIVLTLRSFSGWRFQNPEMVRKVADDHFYSQVDAVLDGRDTAFHFGSWRQVKTQVKFEQLMETSPLYSGLTLEQREEVARNYDISLGYMTLEHTQPQPPPSHTWVEPPLVCVRSLSPPAPEQ